MPQFEPGVYVIFPKSSNNQPAFAAIGPIPLIWPPQDMPVFVSDKFIESWTISSAENNTFTVFAGRGHPNDYKWIVRDKALYASSVSPPDSFRFESAGDGLWKIGLFGQDAVLTVGDEEEFPSLISKPADGSDAQLFHVTKQYGPS